jgi:hypothetical protein
MAIPESSFLDSSKSLEVCTKVWTIFSASVFSGILGILGAGSEEIGVRI